MTLGVRLLLSLACLAVALVGMFNPVALVVWLVLLTVVCTWPEREGV